MATESYPKTHLVLGSSSKWRRQLFAEWGFQGDSVATCAADIDEKAIRDPDAKILTIKIANAKADAILAEKKIPARAQAAFPHQLLICTDQVIVWNDTIREKPENAEQARFFLKSYKDHPAEAIDGVVVINPATGQRWEGVATAKIFWKEIDDAKIDALIAKGDIFTCAGGFIVEELQDYISKMDGDVDIMMGFPKALTLRLLSEAAHAAGII